MFLRCLLVLLCMRAVGKLFMCGREPKTLATYRIDLVSSKNFRGYPGQENYYTKNYNIKIYDKLILLVQVTQISNMKVIGFMVELLEIFKLWHLSNEFYGER